MKKSDKLAIWIAVIVTVFFLGAITLNYKYGEKRQISSYEVEYEIESIRVDDDGEYHITAHRIDNGKIVSFSDVTPQLTRTIHTPGPRYIETYDDSCCGKGEYTFKSARAILPQGYLIATFDD